MAKIDIDKFISAWLKARVYCSDNECVYVLAALKEQGLTYKDGEIVELEQKDAGHPTERRLEKAKDTIRKLKILIVQSKGFNRKHRDEVFDLLDYLYKIIQEEANL